MRLTERLSLVEQQIAQVEAERDGVARSGAKLSIVDSPEGSDAQAAAKIAMLARLKGIGENDATLLIHEIFYRGFRNRRELASWVGITPPLGRVGTRNATRESAAMVRPGSAPHSSKWLGAGCAIMSVIKTNGTVERVS